MVYVDLNTTDYGGLVAQATKLLSQKLTLPPGFTYKWSGEYEFELRAKKRLELIPADNIFRDFPAPLHGVSFRN